MSVNAEAIPAFLTPMKKGDEQRVTIVIRGGESEETVAVEINGLDAIFAGTTDSHIIEVDCHEVRGDDPCITVTIHANEDGNPSLLIYSPQRRFKDLQVPTGSTETASYGIAGGAHAAQTTPPRPVYTPPGPVNWTRWWLLMAAVTVSVAFGLYMFRLGNESETTEPPEVTHPSSNANVPSTPETWRDLPQMPNTDPEPTPVAPAKPATRPSNCTFWKPHGDRVESNQPETTGLYVVMCQDGIYTAKKIRFKSGLYTFTGLAPYSP